MNINSTQTQTHLNPFPLTLAIFMWFHNNMNIFFNLLKQPHNNSSKSSITAATTAEFHHQTHQSSSCWSPPAVVLRQYNTCLLLLLPCYCLPCHHISTIRPQPPHPKSHSFTPPATYPCSWYYHFCYSVTLPLGTPAAAPLDLPTNPPAPHWRACEPQAHIWIKLAMVGPSPVPLWITKASKLFIQFMYVCM